MGAVKVIFGAITWFTLIILLFLPLGILWLWKLILIVFSWKKRIRLENNEEAFLLPIATGDSMLSVDSSWKKPIVNFGYVLRFEDNQQKFTIDQLREHFATTFLNENCDGGRYDKLFSYLVTRGGHVFRATGIQTLRLTEHIKEATLEKSMSLERFLADWLLNGYPENRPCWELVLVTGHSEAFGETFAMAFKIHHALADGYSLLHILDKLSSNTSPYLVKDFPESGFTQFCQLLEAPLNMSMVSGMPVEKNPFRVKSIKPYQWMLSFTSFPLDKLKDIRRKDDVHMTSVILTIIIGALRQHILAGGVEGVTDKDIPEKFTIGNTLPWPRHPSRQSGLANRDKICNHWVAAVFNAHLIEADPIIRLKKIETELVAIQRSGLVKFLKLVLFPLFWITPHSITGGITTKDPGMGAGLTSIVGGDNYSILGCSISNINPYLAIHDNTPFVPLSSFTFSHSGKLELTLGANPSVFKDQQTLDNICHKLCHDEFNKIISALEV